MPPRRGVTFVTFDAMTRLGLVGAGGRMGRLIAALAGSEQAVVAGGTGRAGDLARLAAACDVLVDFSSPDALDAVLAAAEAAGTAVLVGTTGLGRAHHARIDRAATRIAVLQAANTSLGIALLRRLVGQAAAALGPDWDIEIVEAHHRHKKDAPSGTALLLGAAAGEGRGAGPGALDRLDRMERPLRQEGGIYYASLRGGSVAGDHQVVFAGEGERLELGHRAEGRETFARGALRAARWLHGRSPGRYGMDDVLDLP
jgi:4-hydroxy-tetrahydrodipicolinate reductase